MQSEIARVVLLVTQALEQIGIPYAVGGSICSTAPCMKSNRRKVIAER